MTTTFENVKIVIIASLTAVHGTTSAAGGFTPNASADPSPAGTVRVIEQGNNTALGICINFPELLSVAVKNGGQGGNTPDQLDRIEESVKAKIERKFRDAGFPVLPCGRE